MFRLKLPTPDPSVATGHMQKERNFFTKIASCIFPKSNRWNSWEIYVQLCSDPSTEKRSTVAIHFSECQFIHSLIQPRFSLLIDPTDEQFHG